MKAPIRRGSFKYLIKTRWRNSWTQSLTRKSHKDFIHKMTSVSATTDTESSSRLKISFINVALATSKWFLSHCGWKLQNCKIKCTCLLVLHNPSTRPNIFFPTVPIICVLHLPVLFFFGDQKISLVLQGHKVFKNHKKSTPSPPTSLITIFFLLCNQEIIENITYLFTGKKIWELDEILW